MRQMGAMAAHPSLKEIAYDLIRRKILDHEFEPGSRIREDLLASELSMSRTPVREAINQLVAEGLIVNKPRIGLFFVELTKEDMIDILNVREGLEIMAIEECINKKRTKETEKIDSILVDFEKTFTESDFQEHYRIDSLFHKAIAELSGNRKLIEFIHEVEDLMRIIRGLKSPDFSDNKKRRSIELHRKIVECIKKGDKAGARSALQTIIQGTKKQLQLS